MNTQQELFKYIYIKNKNSKTFLLLHGTGGDENDLIPLVNQVEPSYSILSLRGNVNEQGMNRFFERYPDGFFNLKSIETEVKKLSQFLDLWLKKNSKTFKDLVFFGYSNGSNFALSFMLLYPDIIKQAILFHPAMPLTSIKDSNLKSTKIFVTSGKRDPYLNSENINNLKNILEKAGAQVSFYQHEGGHELREEEIVKAKTFIREVCS